MFVFLISTNISSLSFSNSWSCGGHSAAENISSYVSWFQEASVIHGSQEADNHNTPEKPENHDHTLRMNTVFLP